MTHRAGDALNAWIEADLQIGLGTRKEPIPWIFFLGGRRRQAVALLLLGPEHRFEELLLATEMVVERALGHPCFGGDGFERCPA